MTNIMNSVYKRKNVLNSDSEIIPGNTVGKPEDSVSQLVANITKARNVIGWNPDYDIKRGIKDFSNWLGERINYYKQ